MGDLRPIALCNVSYKLISKVLANRMKPLLDRVISPNQSAFISGRLITDNIMVSFEVLHYLKRKRVGKEGYMAVKLDMSKAYDRVEWNFIEAIMGKMGFDVRWARLLSQCFFTVRHKGWIHGCRVANGAPSISHRVVITPGGGAAPSTASWILRRCRGVAVVGLLQNNTGRGVGVPRRLRRESKN
ncbi:hypothetical protein AgCh_030665 [Apium graveolens]